LNKHREQSFPCL